MRMNKLTKIIYFYINKTSEENKTKQIFNILNNMISLSAVIFYFESLLDFQLFSRADLVQRLEFACLLISFERALLFLFLSTWKEQ